MICGGDNVVLVVGVGLVVVGGVCLCDQCGGNVQLVVEVVVVYQVLVIDDDGWGVWNFGVLDECVCGFDFFLYGIVVQGLDVVVWGYVVGFVEGGEFIG